MLIESILIYVVELARFLLISFEICELKIKNWLAAVCAGAASIFISGLLAAHYRLSDYEFFFISLAAVTTYIFTKGRKKLLYIFLSAVGLTMIDVVARTYAVYILGVSAESIDNNFTIYICVKSLSMILTILFFSIKFKNKERFLRIINKAYRFNAMIFMMLGITFWLYISSISIIGSDNVNKTYMEIASLGISSALVMVGIICVMLINSENLRRQYKLESDMTKKLLESQQRYYQMLLDKDKEFKKVKHDLKNHFYAMYSLFKDDKAEELEEYFKQLDITFTELNTGVSTGNDLVNAIVNDLLVRYEIEDLKLVWSGVFPPGLRISNMHLCAIFSNLLENSFYAVSNICGEKTIKVIVKVLESNLYILIENSSFEKAHIIGGSLLSTKNDAGEHGLGTQNVKDSVKAYNGRVKYSQDDAKFSVEIILPNVINEMQDSQSP